MQFFLMIKLIKSCSLFNKIMLDLDTHHWCDNKAQWWRTSCSTVCPYLSVQSMSAPEVNSVCTNSRLIISSFCSDWPSLAKYWINARLLATRILGSISGRDWRADRGSEYSSWMSSRPIPPTCRSWIPSPVLWLRSAT